MVLVAVGHVGSSNGGLLHAAHLRHLHYHARRRVISSVLVSSRVACALTPSRRVYLSPDGLVSCKKQVPPRMRRPLICTRPPPARGRGGRRGHAASVRSGHSVPTPSQIGAKPGGTGARGGRGGERKWRGEWRGEAGCCKPGRRVCESPECKPPFSPTAMACGTVGAGGRGNVSEEMRPPPPPPDTSPHPPGAGITALPGVVACSERL